MWGNVGCVLVCVRWSVVGVGQCCVCVGVGEVECGWCG